ncbi:MAG: protein kinase [Myxococcales bacterium]|nr:protein kinase [Myxococcales bacterium]
MTPQTPTDSRRTFVVGPCLGRGGFGEVYRAVMKQPGGMELDVAVKLLRRDISSASQAVLRLRDEARLLSALHHPAILRIHDMTSLDGRVCLVTEYVDGQDLSDCLEGSDAMGLRALLQTLGTVAGALDAAYNRPGPHGEPLRIVHRDIKPSNIRIGSGGEVKLLDFGIARTDALTREARTGTDMMVGSPPYMGPERFLRGDPDPASDIFALGAVLYEGVANKRLFSMPVTVQAAHAVEPSRYQAHITESLARVAHRRPSGSAEVSAHVMELIEHLVAFEPAERPSAGEASQLFDALADLAQGPTLDGWTRRRTWPVLPQRDRGELGGRSLVEGSAATDDSATTHSLDADPHPPTPRPAATPTRPLGWLVGGFGATVGVGVVSVVGLGVALFGLPELGLDRSSTAPVQTPAASPGPGVAASHDAAPTAIDDAANPDDEPQGTPKEGPPSVAPQPVVAPPELAVEPKPPTTTRTGTIWAPTGSVPFQLVGTGGRTVTLQPGDRERVRAGDWVVHADWGPRQPQSTDGDHRFTLMAGQVQRVSCNKNMGTCSNKEAAP